MTNEIGGIAALGTAVMLAATAGCGFEGADDYAGYERGDPSAASQGSGTSVAPGQLTAGDWDDNRNFDRFVAWAEGFANTHRSLPAFPVADRVAIAVVNEAGAPVPNAIVTVADAGGIRLRAPTASDGRILFFPRRDGADGSTVRVTAEPPPGEEGGAAVSVDAPAGAEWTVTLPGASGALPSALDLAFVIDATGSMGDEMRYVQAELDRIVDTVQEELPGLSLRFGLIVYRDQGDEYVTRSFDFTGDLAAFRSHLAAQAANGGGDYPEAMHDAIDEMNQLSWRSGNAARLAFLIADAPPHDDRVGSTLDGVEQARRTGVKIFSVAASGVADLAEYVMRVASQTTLARYVFLTDDSGIGGSHAEPHIPCYRVQYLGRLMVRLIIGEMRGALAPLADEDVLRTAGDPVDGVCSLEDGTEAYL